jgi:hypothetical protein
LKDNEKEKLLQEKAAKRAARQQQNQQKDTKEGFVDIMMNQLRDGNIRAMRLEGDADNSFIDIDNTPRPTSGKQEEVGLPVTQIAPDEDDDTHEEDETVESSTEETENEIPTVDIENKSELEPEDTTIVNNNDAV